MIYTTYMCSPSKDVLYLPEETVLVADLAEKDNSKIKYENVCPKPKGAKRLSSPKAKRVARKA